MILFLFLKIYFLGPFQTGVREPGYDFLYPPGEEKYVISLNDTFYSTLSKNGVFLWKETQRDSEGYIILNPDTIELNREYEHHGWGVAGLTYIYFDTTFEQGFYLAYPERISKFYIDSFPYFGNPYGYKDVPIPLFISEGKHRILLITGREYGKVRIRFEKAPEIPFIYNKWAILPDIIKDSVYEFYIGFWIINPTDKIFKKIKLSGFGENLEAEEKEIDYLMPFEIIYEDLKFKITNKDFKRETLSITVSLKGDEFDTMTVFYLNIKSKDEPLRITFKSKIDNSVQYFGMRFPKIKGDYKKGVIFSLHGAGVEAWGQSMAYRQKDSLFVITPTNRRPFGFDWQDLGMLDLWEIVDYVKKNFNVDTERFYLTGHSMGGHGTYFNGIHFADRFAAIVPSAGWVSFRTYVPYFLQGVKLFGSPEQINIRERVLYTEDIQRFVRNALNVPFLIVHGREDKSVPAFHPRFMLSLLKRNGIKVKLWEVPEMEHWWNIKETEGIDCVDADTIIKFLKKHRRTVPDSFEFYFSDLGVNNRFYYAKILEPEKYFYPGYLKLKRKGDKIFIKTENIYAFELNLSFLKIEKISLNLDEQSFELKNKKDKKGIEKIIFIKDKKWKKVKEFKRKLPSKTPSNPGLIKNILRNKILIVYSTSKTLPSEEGGQGDVFLFKKESKRKLIFNNWNYHLARNISFSLLFRGNTKVKILPDTLFNKKMLSEYNVIFIGQKESFKGDVEEVIKKLPEKIFEKYGIYNDLLVFIYPSYPFSYKNMNLFIIYSDKSQIKDAFKISLFASGLGLPDGIFVKNSKDLRTKGFAGLGMFLWNKNYKDFEEIAFP